VPDKRWKILSFAGVEPLKVERRKRSLGLKENKEQANVKQCNRGGS
jgi:hypothetical protein